MDFFILYWILVLVITAGLVSASVFCIVALTDLEADLVNPIDLARRLNPLFSTDVSFHSALCLLFLYFLVFICIGNYLNYINIINYYKNIYLYMYMLFTGQNKIFAADIFKLLPVYKRRYAIKIAFYIVTFFLYLYWFIYYLVNTHASPALKTMKIPVY
ncbi:hypothetical protein DDB_G0270698 [Dictyostelium discoideum AX4]|uniref:Uncharacterized protein n=1 Tax=Dictyostelium discoideum TaxID=44689 RepID=Q55CP5_DICDI|nr:hypothetical protein DDB_G0270698 [Dictyostelium discoideum AX4]EAL72699.1 hypothetical protein DDB_G0270698 [Dictyostelium discoideum AX4]|eukprot:XP_646436.1 hypothetical protein DDB_G0270698 [Dictyostelium discoideum AX4]